MNCPEKRFLRSHRKYTLMGPSITFFHLPEEILENIFSYLPCRQVSQLRIVSRDMDRICGNTLTVNFKRLIKDVVEGERDLDARWSTQSTWHRFVIRLIDSLLIQLDISIGFGIETRECCFFPGAILDQVEKIYEYLTPEIDQLKRREMKKIGEELKLLFKLSISAVKYFDKRFNTNTRYIMRSNYRPPFRHFRFSYISAIAGGSIDEIAAVNLLIENLQIQIHDRVKLLAVYEEKQHELPCRFRASLIELQKYNIELQKKGLEFLEQRLIHLQDKTLAIVTGRFHGIILSPLLRATTRRNIKPKRTRIQS